MTPKPAYDELMKLVKGKWWTKTTLRTDADGAARLRGFLGDYQVKVTVGGKRAAEGTFVLTQRGDNRWSVQLK
jgi:hypothetical protein